MKVLVTGANGFIGAELVAQLSELDYVVSAISRRVITNTSDDVKRLKIADFKQLLDADSGDYRAVQTALQLVNTVIHTAARVHVMNDDVKEPLAEFRKVNRAVTLALARQASDAGVKRFIFISSVKVNGEQTSASNIFEPDDTFVPTDPYALSKYEAEQALLELAEQTGMEVVIIRPPLVYGPGVKANFSSMIRWVNKGIPLPLGRVDNMRSLIALDNLVSFIITCIEHPKAANEVFLISDGEDVSTTQLLRKVAIALGKKILLLPIPISGMTFFARFIGKSDVVSRLFSSLQVDSSKARDLLGWQPVITMDEQLKKTADAYLENEKTI